MINKIYQNAMAETLEYLNTVRKEDVEKIPNKFMNFLKENSSKEYKSNADFSKSFADLDILPETKGIILMICYYFWCENETQKYNFLKLLKLNSDKVYEELNKKYSIENLFKKNENMVDIVKQEEKSQSIYIRIFAFFKKLFYKEF